MSYPVLAVSQFISAGSYGVAALVCLGWALCGPRRLAIILIPVGVYAAAQAAAAAMTAMILRGGGQ